MNDFTILFGGDVAVPVLAIQNKMCQLCVVSDKLVIQHAIASTELHDN